MAIYAGGKRIDGGGGGGSGFLLGPETNQFTSTTARDTYATNDAAWLSEYDGNTGFLVQVTVGGTATYYRRNNSAWEDVGGIIGITASQAAINAAVAAAVIDFRTQAQITTEIDAAIVAGVMGFQTAAQITASITAALSNYLTASDVAALIQTGITSLGLLDTATLSDGTLSLALTQGGPITADGFVEITGGTSAPDDADAITGRNQFYINTTDSVLYYSLPSNDTWSKSGHTDVSTGAVVPTTTTSEATDNIYFQTNGDIHYSVEGETTWLLLPGTGGGGSGGIVYNVSPADTSGTSGLVTLSIPSLTAYFDGMIASFQIPGIINDANVALRVNALTSYEMVKNTDLLGFADGELEPESWVLARLDITDTQWITNVSADYSTVYVHSAGVVQTGSSIHLTPSFTAGASSSIAFKFRTKVLNTGPITVRVIGSGISAAALRKQDGTEYAAGELPVGLTLAMIYDSDNARWDTSNFLPGSGVGVTDLAIANRGADTLDVTSSTGTNATIPTATDTEAGLMSAPDKDAVDNITPHPSTDLSVGNQGIDSLDVESSTGVDATLVAATTSLAGLMTAADKAALNAGAGGGARSRGARILYTTTAIPVNPGTAAIPGVDYTLDGTQAGFTVGSAAFFFPVNPPDSPNNDELGFWAVLRHSESGIDTDLSSIFVPWGLEVNDQTNRRSLHVLLDPVVPSGETIAGYVYFTVGTTTDNGVGVLLARMFGAGLAMRDNLFLDLYYAVNAVGAAAPADDYTFKVLPAQVGGTANRIELVVSELDATPVLTDGMEFQFFSKQHNTGAVDIQINSGGAILPAVKQDTEPFTVLDIEVGTYIRAVYDEPDMRFVTDIADNPFVYNVAPADVSVNGASQFVLAVPEITGNDIPDNSEFRFIAPADSTNNLAVVVNTIAGQLALKQDGTQITADEVTSGMFIRAIYDRGNTEFYFTNVIVAGTGGGGGGNSLVYPVSAGDVAGSADTITLTVSDLPSIPALVAGMEFQFYAEGHNTGAVTIQVNNDTARAAVKEDGNGFVSGLLRQGDFVRAVFDGSRFVTNLGEAGNTNLTVVNRNDTHLTVASDTGSNAIIPPATISEAGLMSSVDKAAVIANSIGIADWVRGVATAKGASVFDTEDGTAFRCIADDDGNNGPPNGDNANFEAWGAGELVETDVTGSLDETNRSFDIAFRTSSLVHTNSHIFTISVEDPTIFDINQDTVTFNATTFRAHGLSTTDPTLIIQIRNESGSTSYTFTPQILLDFDNGASELVVYETSGAITLAPGAIAFHNFTFRGTLDMSFANVGTIQARVRTLGLTGHQQDIRFAFTPSNDFSFQYDYTLLAYETTKVRLLNAELNMVDAANNDFPALANNAFPLGNLLSSIQEQVHDFDFIYARYEGRREVPDTITGVTYTKDANGNYSFGLPAPWTDDQASLANGGFHYQAVVIGYGSESASVSDPFEVVDNTEIHTDELARVIQENVGAQVLNDLTDFPKFIGWSPGKSINGEVGDNLCDIRFWDATAEYYIGDVNDETVLVQSQQLDAGNFSYVLSRNYGKLVFDVTAAVVGATIHISGHNANNETITEELIWAAGETHKVTTNTFSFPSSGITFTPTGWGAEILTLSVREWEEHRITSNKYAVIDQKDVAELGYNILQEHRGFISGDIDVHVQTLLGQVLGSHVNFNASKDGNGYARLATITSDFGFRWSYILPDGTPGIEAIGRIGFRTNEGTQSTDDYLVAAEAVFFDAGSNLLFTDSNGYPTIARITHAGIGSHGLAAVAQPYDLYEYFSFYYARNGDPTRSALFGLNSDRQVNRFTPSSINLSGYVFWLEDGALGTVLFSRNPGQAATDNFDAIHGNRNLPDTIAGRMFNPKGFLNDADVSDIITADIPGHLSSYKQFTISGSTPAPNTASTTISQLYVVDTLRFGNANYPALYTSIMGTHDWIESVSFDGVRVKDFTNGTQYIAGDIVRDGDNEYDCDADYQGALSPRDNPNHFSPVEAIVLAAPEKNIDDVDITFRAPAGDIRNATDWFVDVSKTGLVTADFVTIANGQVTFREKATSTFPALATGEFSFNVRNYANAEQTYGSNAYEVSLRNLSGSPQVYLRSEQFTVPANSTIEVPFTSSEVVTNFETGDVFDIIFHDVTGSTTLHVQSNSMSVIEGKLIFEDARSDALEIDRGSNIAIVDRKNDVTFPIANTVSFLGKYKEEIERNKLPTWRRGDYDVNQAVIFDGQIFWAKQPVTLSDESPLVSTDLWQAMYAEVRPYDEDNYGPINYQYILWGSSLGITSSVFRTGRVDGDPHDTLTGTVSGASLQIHCNVKVTDMVFSSLISSVTVKNHTTTAVDITDIGFVGDIVRSGNTTPEAGSKQTIATTTDTFPINIPERDPAVANSGETQVDITFLPPDPSIHFEELRIGDTVRLYFEATPFLSSDLEVLFNGFDGDFEIEGEIDHPNGDKVLVETAPSERALRSYVYIGDEVINNYSTLVFGLELNNADVTMRNSYQDLFIDLGSLRRNLETVESGGFKSGPGYLGYDYTLSQGDTFSLVYRANAFHVRESLESEEANEPTTGELDYIHDLNPIGGFNRYQYYIGGAYLHTDGRVWIIHDHASGLFSMDPNTGRVERRSATSILQWGGGNLQDPSGLSYDDTDNKFMIMYHHQTDNNYRIQKVEPGNTNNSQFGTEQSSPHYGLQKVGSLWYCLRVVGTTTTLISIDSTGQFLVERDLQINIGACALTWDISQSRMIAVSRTTDTIYSFNLISNNVDAHGSAFDSQLTIGGVVYLGDADNQRTIAISNNNSTPGKRNKVYDLLHRTGPARRIRTVIARR